MFERNWVWPQRRIGILLLRGSTQNPLECCPTIAPKLTPMTFELKCPARCSFLLGPHFKDWVSTKGPVFEKLPLNNLDKRNISNTGPVWGKVIYFGSDSCILLRAAFERNGEDSSSSFRTLPNHSSLNRLPSSKCQHFHFDVVVCSLNHEVEIRPTVRFWKKKLSYV